VTVSIDIVGTADAKLGPNFLPVSVK